MSIVYRSHCLTLFFDSAGSARATLLPPRLRPRAARAQVTSHVSIPFSKATLYRAMIVRSTLAGSREAHAALLAAAGASMAADAGAKPSPNPASPRQTLFFQGDSPLGGSSGGGAAASAEGAQGARGQQPGGQGPAHEQAGGRQGGPNGRPELAHVVRTDPRAHTVVAGNLCLALAGTAAASKYVCTSAEMSQRLHCGLREASFRPRQL